MQPDLFRDVKCGEYSQIEPIPAHNDRQTSVEAALKARSFARGALETVYACIEAAGQNGRTRPEIEHLTGISGNTVRPRVDELKGCTRRGLPVRIRVRPERRVVKRGNRTQSYEVLVAI